MKLAAAASLIAALAWMDVFAQPTEDRKAHVQHTPLRARLSDEVIRDAVKQALAEAPGDSTGASPTALSGNRDDSFSRKFEDAKVPGCLNPDALKHMGATGETKNWTYGIGGLFAAPLWLAAAATGKCR